MQHQNPLSHTGICGQGLLSDNQLMNFQPLKPRPGMSRGLGFFLYLPA
jgi:hypothetical protein